MILRVDSQCTVEGHRIGECCDRDTGREVNLDGTSRVGGLCPVAQLAEGCHPPGPHRPLRGERIAVGVGRGDLHDPATDAGDRSGPIKLKLTYGAVVADHSKPVDDRGARRTGGGSSSTSREHQCRAQHGCQSEQGPHALRDGRPAACSEYLAMGFDCQLSLQFATISLVASDGDAKPRHR